MYQRYLFYTRDQNDGEPFDHFLTEIQRLVKVGEFGDQEKSILRDRIVLGMRDKQFQERIIKLKDDEVHLEKTIEYCRGTEATKTQVKTVQWNTVQEVKTQLEIQRKTSENSNTFRINQNRNLNLIRSSNNINNQRINNTYQKGTSQICSRCNFRLNFNAFFHQRENLLEMQYSESFRELLLDKNCYMKFHVIKMSSWKNTKRYFRG